MSSCCMNHSRENEVTHYYWDKEARRPAYLCPVCAKAFKLGQSNHLVRLIRTDQEVTLSPSVVNEFCDLITAAEDKGLIKLPEVEKLREYLGRPVK